MTRPMQEAVSPCDARQRCSRRKSWSGPIAQLSKHGAKYRSNTLDNCAQRGLDLRQTTVAELEVGLHVRQTDRVPTGRLFQSEDTCKKPLCSQMSSRKVPLQNGNLMPQTGDFLPQKGHLVGAIHVHDPRTDICGCRTPTQSDVLKRYAKCSMFKCKVTRRALQPPESHESQRP